MLRAGFSLIELMIYTTILGLISIGVFTAYNFFVSSSIESRSVAELQQDSTLALDPVRSHFANADRIRILTNGDQECAITTNFDSSNRTGLNFTATDKLTLDDYKGPGGNASRSISFWMIQSDQTISRSILSFGTSSASQQWRVYSDNTSGAIGVDIHNAQITATTDIVDGQWHHVMVVFDNATADTLTPATLSIYIDGRTETLSAASTPPQVNTDNTSVNVSIGGSNNDSNFIGHLASVRIWHRALTAAEIWPEVLSVNAQNRDRLELELNLNNTILDTSPQAHAVTGFSNPTYTTLVNSYARKTSYGFSTNPDNSAFHHLWKFDYIDTTSDQSLDRCMAANRANGWVKSSANDWLQTGDDFFTLTDGVLSINAEIAKDVVGSTISVGDRSLILVGRGLRHTELCRIAPNMAEFDTGGANIAEAVVRIDDDSLEATDELHFFNASKSGPITETTGNVNRTYYSYKNIMSGGVVIWPDITAEYEPASGIMKICTNTGTSCDTPVPTPQPLERWKTVFRNLTYTNSSQTYKGKKTFLFSLGRAIPCPINNDIACRYINNNDHDDNASTCYHWFDSVRYDDLGTGYACHAAAGTGVNAFSQCPADWEDARDDAASTSRKLFGLTGYLATITSTEESICAFERARGFGWLGGSDRECERSQSCGNPASNSGDAIEAYGKYNSKDANGEGYWYWVTGPEGEWSSAEADYTDHDGGAGQGLYFGHDNGSDFIVYDPPDIAAPTAYRIPPSFTRWARNEPNNWINSGGVFPEEDYLHALMSGNWNDFTSYYTVDGFVIEYGGLSADPHRVLTKRSDINTFEFLKNCP
jgi:hypothetical protein